MKKNAFIVISLIGFFLILGCAGDKIDNQWADHEITIDGKFADWEGIAQYTLEDQNLVMGLANDENNLYLMFRGNDEQMARRIQMMGVTVWLNKEDKKQKDYGICYTGSTDIHISRRPEMAPSGQKPKELDERMEKMRAKRRENLPNPGRIFIIEGDQKSERSEIAPEGPAAGSAYKDGVFCYEFKMPLPISAESGKKTKVGLELGGLSQEDRNAMRQEMGGMPRRGERPDEGEPPDGDMSGRPDDMGGLQGGMGGRPGGMGRGERPPDGQRFEKQEVWFTVVLADKK